jgi:hypothetical protein
MSNGRDLRACAGELPSRPATPTSFRAYVETRKYDFGRGRAASWAFIAFARGDPAFPDIRSWPELRGYLERGPAEPELIEGAQSVWRSFTAYRSLDRRRRTWRR